MHSPILSSTSYHRFTKDISTVRRCIRIWVIFVNTMNSGRKFKVKVCCQWKMDCNIVLSKTNFFLYPHTVKTFVICTEALKVNSYIGIFKLLFRIQNVNHVVFIVTVGRKTYLIMCRINLFTAKIRTVHSCSFWNSQNVFLTALKTS